jgi:polyisoprenoid-binding protein YceI
MGDKAQIAALRDSIDARGIAGMKVVARIFGLLLAVLLLAALPGIIPGAGQPCAPFRDGKVDPARLDVMLTAADDGRLYRIETEHSEFGFAVTSSLREVRGQFHQVQGGMAVDTLGLEDDQVLVAIRTASLETNCDFIEGMLRGENFFDVEHYPEILFVSTRFEWVTQTRATLTGDLTLHGVTRPVTFDVQLTNLFGEHAEDPDTILVRATSSIRRSDFGMKAIPSVVDDVVRLGMNVRARKYYATASIE